MSQTLLSSGILSSDGYRQFVVGEREVPCYIETEDEAIGYAQKVATCVTRGCVTKGRGTWHNSCSPHSRTGVLLCQGVPGRTR